MNHGERESIEIFEVMGRASPSIRWRGCIPLPASDVGNSVAALADGTIYVTVSYRSSDRRVGREFALGLPTGYIVKWRQRSGWSRVPHSQGTFPNGLEVKPSGSALFVTYTGTREVAKLFGRPIGARSRRVRLPFMVDNLKFDDQKRLWLAGQDGLCGRAAICSAPFEIAYADQGLLAFHSYSHIATAPEFGAATTALHIAGELWIGTYKGNRIARLKYNR